MIDNTTLFAKRTRLALLGLAGAGALVAAGCSSSSNSKGDNQTSAPPGGGSAQVVQVKNDSKLGNILTDSKGKALYTSDQEASGKIVCSTSACTAIWTPVTVAAGQQPSGPDSVSGKLGTVKRPDGKLQVTLGGRPLYTFTFDHSAGEVSGDGTKDSFDGTDFTWHVAAPAGISTATPTQAPTSGDGNGGYGGGY